MCSVSSVSAAVGSGTHGTSCEDQGPGIRPPRPGISVGIRDARVYGGCGATTAMHDMRVRNVDISIC